MVDLRRYKEYMTQLRAMLLYYEADLSRDDDSIGLINVFKDRDESSDIQYMKCRFGDYEIVMKIDCILADT